MNKNAQSPGFAWIIGLLMLFVLAIGFIVLNQVLVVHISPAADLLATNSPYLNASEVIDIQADNTKYMSFWAALPFIFVFLIVIYVIMAAIRRGDEE